MYVSMGSKGGSAYTTKCNAKHLQHKRLKYVMEKDLAKVKVTVIKSPKEFSIRVINLSTMQCTCH